MTEMVTISKKEYERLKALDSEVQSLEDFKKHLDRSLADAEAGRIIEL